MDLLGFDTPSSSSSAPAKRVSLCKEQRTKGDAAEASISSERTKGDAAEASISSERWTHKQNTCENPKACVACRFRLLRPLWDSKKLFRLEDQSWVIWRRSGIGCRACIAALSRGTHTGTGRKDSLLARCKSRNVDRQSLRKHERLWSHKQSVDRYLKRQATAKYGKSSITRDQLKRVWSHVRDGGKVIEGVPGVGKRRKVMKDRQQ